MLLAALETPAGSVEFLKHPDFQTVAAFLLGWVLYASVSALLASLEVKGIVMKLWKLLSAPARFCIIRKESDDKISVDSSTYSHSFDLSSLSDTDDNVQQILIRMLFISFITGSLANFRSLLSFSQDSKLCAFVVAWSLLSLETARLMGLFTILLALRKLGMKQWELTIFSIWIITGLAFTFINAALAAGVTQAIPQLNTSFCFRTHFWPASVVLITIYLGLEVFVVIRLWFKLRQLVFRRGCASNYLLLDIRVTRALSLMFLELVTSVPSAIVTNTLGDFIPYSVGAIAVLYAFSREANDRNFTDRQDSPETSPSSACPSSAQEDICIAGPAYSWLNPGRPLSARSSSDVSFLPRWDVDQRVVRSGTTRSSKTIDSRTARSIHEAVIHQATIKKLSANTNLACSDPGLASSSHSVVATTELAPPSRTLRPLRPRLVILTQTSDTYGYPIVQAEGSRLSVNTESITSVESAPAERFRILTSRFSSPSWTTTRSTVSSNHSQSTSHSPTSRGSEGGPFMDPNASDSRSFVSLRITDRESTARSIATSTFGPRPI
ncbi:hypothetical protein F5890DRAFT_821030 [Lentinula detonsa]|uniref:Uncharacterized protein n=1 Tax=Lentinula detonsa TaxID=2804962 RepID=A0AA38UWP2_9AGAR|nr:hypothetical protein F5890DRAFT_821030 [Lentinula detonsa]